MRGVEHHTPDPPEGMRGSCGDWRAQRRQRAPHEQGSRDHPGLQAGAMEEEMEEEQGERGELDEVDTVHPQASGGVESSDAVVNSVEAPQPGNAMVRSVEPVAEEVEDEEADQELEQGMQRGGIQPALLNQRLRGANEQEAQSEEEGSLATHVPAWRLLLEQAHVVWLRASPEALLERVRAQGDTRPMEGWADPLQAIRRIEEARRPSYALAHQRVNTEEHDLEASILDIIEEHHMDS